MCSTEMIDSKYLKELKIEQINYILENIVLFKTNKDFFFQNLIYNNIINTEILNFVDPNNFIFIKGIVNNNTVLEYYITNNKFNALCLQYLSQILFIHNFGIWVKYNINFKINLEATLKNSLCVEAFKYLLQNFDLMTPDLYYLVWKYNFRYLSLITKNLQIAYLYKFVSNENPLAENNLFYLEYLSTKFRIFEIEIKVFKILCDWNSDLQIWNFFISHITKFPIYLDILHYKNKEIKDCVIQKYLQYYSLDTLYNTLKKCIKYSNYTTLQNSYIQGFINVEDCISIFKKYFRNKVKVDDLICNNSNGYENGIYNRIIE